MSDTDFEDKVKQIINDWFQNEGFKARKLTDTPTDSNQVVPKGYVDSAPIADTRITFTDNTTGDVSITKHGFAPKAPNDTTKFLRGDATWAALINTPAWVDEGSIAWVNESTDKTLTFTNSAKSMYLILFAFQTTNGAIDIQFGGDTGSHYWYHQIQGSTGTVLVSTAQSQIELINVAINGMGGAIFLAGTGSYTGVAGTISSDTPQNLFLRGGWSPSGTTLSSIKFLVNSHTVSLGNVHAYSLTF